MEIGVVLLIAVSLTVIAVEYLLLAVIFEKRHRLIKMKKRINDCLDGYFSDEIEFNISKKYYDELVAYSKKKTAADTLFEILSEKPEVYYERNHERFITLMKDINIIPYYKKMLKEKEADHRAYACMRLGKFGRHIKKEGISDELKLNALSEDGQLQYHALMAMSRAGMEEELMEIFLRDSMKIHISHRYIQEILLNYSGDRSSIFHDMLNNCDTYLRSICIKVIVQLDIAEEYRDYYKRLIKNREINLRIACINAIGALKDPYFQKKIGTMLMDTAWQVRAAAAKCLTQIGITECIQELEGAVRDSNWFVRINAAMAIVSEEAGRKRANVIINEGVDRYAEEALRSALKQYGTDISYQGE